MTWDFSISFAARTLYIKTWCYWETNKVFDFGQIWIWMLVLSHILPWTIYLTCLSLSVLNGMMIIMPCRAFIEVKRDKLHRIEHKVVWSVHWFLEFSNDLYFLPGLAVCILIFAGQIQSNMKSRWCFYWCLKSLGSPEPSHLIFPLYFLGLI